MRFLIGILLALIFAQNAHSQEFIRETELFRSNATFFNTDNGTTCLNFDRYDALNSSACSSKWISAYWVTDEMIVTRIRVELLQAGDTSGTCILTMLDTDQAAIPEMPAMSFSNATAIASYDFAPTSLLALSVNDFVLFKITTSDNCKVTTNPKGHVVLYGYFLEDLK